MFDNHDTKHRLLCIVAAAQKQLNVETSTIVSSVPGQQLINSSKPTARSQKTQRKLLTQTERQEAHAQQSFYRICTPITTFKVQDPDPNAVDGGNVLGLRFEIMSQGRFLKPYFVMLNRPYFKSKNLRVHRHTLPPAIPIGGLSARYLPQPTPEREDPTKQDLDRFVRTLRREIVRYHNRMGVTADLRRALGVQEEREDLTMNDVVNVGIADIEAKQIKLTWADERSGRLVMDDDGKVTKLMVFGSQGRDWVTSKELLGDNDRVEDVVKQLQEYAEG